MKLTPSSWNKSGKWYNRLVGREGHYFHQQVIVPKVLEKLGLKSGDNILDIGCGQGFFANRIPKNINLESAPTYHLYLQKQPGTLSDQLEFTFYLPGYLLEKDSGKQNLQFTTDLSTDREFKIEVAKK